PDRHVFERTAQDCALLGGTDSTSDCQPPRVSFGIGPTSFPAQPAGRGSIGFRVFHLVVCLPVPATGVVFSRALCRPVYGGPCCCSGRESLCHVGRSDGLSQRRESGSACREVRAQNHGAVSRIVNNVLKRTDVLQAADDLRRRTLASIARPLDRLIYLA